jgi:glycyl-tRNA synthetase (class II)
VNDLKFHFNCHYDEKDSIGKRYRRQDAIGTPYCVTVDHDTLTENTVTLRNRDDNVAGESAYQRAEQHHRRQGEHRIAAEDIIENHSRLSDG